MALTFIDSHQWIDLQEEENIAVVGISDRAQKELGEVVYVELPVVGALFQKDQEIAIVESTKAATDLYAPITGTIIAVNDSLKEAPELVNSHAESDGWLYKVAVQ